VSFASVTNNPNCPAFDGSFFNTDLARANGINSTVQAKPLHWLNIVGNYTYDDSKVLKTTNPLMDPALAQGNRLFQAAAELGEPDRQRTFPLGQHQHGWLLRGPPHGQRFR